VNFRKLGVKTVPRRVGRRAAYGLAALIATVSTVLAAGSSASAATGPHSPGSRQVPPARSIQHERDIRNIRAPEGGKKAARKAVGKTAPKAVGKTAPKAGAKAAKPWTLDIPAIRLTVGLIKLGGPQGGANYLSLPTPPLAVAASDAGWYQFTAVPGAPGNAVIVGHVDTYVGPGAFYNLYQLRKGDPIVVNEGGTRQRFYVTSAREMSKASFPVNQVFGSTEKHMLWLITCGGAFDYKARHYLDNIVIAATRQRNHI
jgi:sortase family protein